MSSDSILRASEPRSARVSPIDEPEAPVCILSLKRLAAIATALIVEDGFRYTHPDLASPTEQPLHACADARETRGRLFSYDARLVLKFLGKNPSLVPLVLRDALPTSTALYCALACVSGIDSYDSCYPLVSSGAFNPALDMHVAKLVGPVWQNLRRLLLRGCRITLHFLETLSQGSAVRTLEVADFSSTTVTDADLAPLPKFTNLTELQLNQCTDITIVTVNAVVLSLKKLKTLSLNNVEIPLPDLFLTILGREDEQIILPNLKYLYLETEKWAMYGVEVGSYLRNRMGPNLAIIGVIPSLDYAATIAWAKRQFRESATAPFERTYKMSINGEDAYFLEKATNLRILRMSIAAVKQFNVDWIARCCPRLHSLFLLSSIFSTTEMIDLRPLTHLRELAISDATLGRLDHLPTQLTSLVVSISAFSSKRCPSLFINSLCQCTSLQKLNLLSAQLHLDGSFGFEPSAITQIFERLTNLKEVAIDSDLFQTSPSGSDQPPQRVAIEHGSLKYLKVIFSSAHDKPVPYVKYAPQLMSFEGMQEEGMRSFDGLAASAIDMRNLRVRVEAEPSSHRSSQAMTAAPLRGNLLGLLVKTVKSRRSSQPRTAWDGSNSSGSSSTNTTPTAPLDSSCRDNSSGASSMSSDSAGSSSGLVEGSAELSRMHDRAWNASLARNPYAFHFLVALELWGARESLMPVATHPKFLRRLKLTDCLIYDSFFNKIPLMEHLRDLEISRCDTINSFDGLRDCKLARIAFNACPQLKERISMRGAHYPNLEVLSLVNVPLVAKIILENLPELRVVTVSKIRPTKIRVRDVPNLLELSMVDVFCPSVQIEAPMLRRWFAEYARRSNSLLAPEMLADDESIPIKLDAPNLRSVSWQADDIPLEIMVRILRNCRYVDRLDCPGIDTDGLRDVVAMIKEQLPLVKRVSCADGDYLLYESLKQSKEGLRL